MNCCLHTCVLLYWIRDYVHAYPKEGGSERTLDEHKIACVVQAALSFFIALGSIMMKMLLLLLCAPTLALVVPTAKHTPITPTLSLSQNFHKAVATASAAMTTASVNVGAALAAGQSEGTGLTLGIDDNRELLVLAVVFSGFWVLYFNWAKDQPDNDSDFFSEYDERRA